jgi:hypothetical protein
MVTTITATATTTIIIIIITTTTHTLGKDWRTAQQDWLRAEWQRFDS